jgi:hypothetical protein
MRKIILIALLLVLALPSAAQSRRTGTYTSFDGVLQVQYMEGWRIGAIYPDFATLLPFEFNGSPEAYQLSLLHSRPDAEIIFYAVDGSGFTPTGINGLDFLQDTIEEDIPDVETNNISLDDGRIALEAIAPPVIVPNREVEFGSINLNLEGTRRVIFFEGRGRWLVAAVLITPASSVDQAFMTIVNSFRLYGSSGDILSLSSNISMELPEGWYRYQDELETRKKMETISLFGEIVFEPCWVYLEIIALDSPAFEFPEEGSNDDYLEAFLNGQENYYEPLDIYAEHLGEGISLYMSEAGDDYQYLSMQVLEENVVIAIIYLGEGFCIDDYFLMINSIREEE